MARADDKVVKGPKREKTVRRCDFILPRVVRNLAFGCVGALSVAVALL